MNVYPQFNTRRADFLRRINALPAATLHRIAERVRECNSVAIVVQFERNPDEHLLDGCDTDMKAQLDDAGFGSFGPM